MVPGGYQEPRDDEDEGSGFSRKSDRQLSRVSAETFRQVDAEEFF
jgi:hypothetical protein